MAQYDVWISRGQTRSLQRSTCAADAMTESTRKCIGSIPFSVIPPFTGCRPPPSTSDLLRIVIPLQQLLPCLVPQSTTFYPSKENVCRTRHSNHERFSNLATCFLNSGQKGSEIDSAHATYPNTMASSTDSLSPSK